MNWNEAFERIRPFAIADVSPYPWPPIRYEKCKALFELAQMSKYAIVELGTGRGLGLAAMRLGTTNNIYTVDHASEETGWLGEKYTVKDNEDAIRQIASLNVDADTTFFRYDARELASYWATKPVIDWVHWDIYGPRLYDDFLAWEKYIAPGGIFSAKVLETDDFGFNKIYTTPHWKYEQGYDGAHILIARREAYS